MSEQVAIIRDVRVGANDRGQPGLSFTTCITESGAACQFAGWEQAGKILATVTDARQLEGSPCWAEAGGNLIRFLRLWDK